MKLNAGSGPAVAVAVSSNTHMGSLVRSSSVSSLIGTGTAGDGMAHVGGSLRALAADLQLLLNMDPSKRPSAQDALQLASFC